MSGGSGGCPVKHTKSSSPPVATATEDGQHPPAPGPQRASGGRWAGVAAWLPFSTRGSSADDATGSVANSSSGGSGSPVSAAVQRAPPGTKQQGDCPVNLVNGSEGGDAGPLAAPSSSSGCPVQHDSAAGGAAASASEPRGLGRVWELLTGGSGGGGDAADPSESPLASAPAPEYNARNNEYVYGQEVAAGQEMPLSTARQRSSIPKAEFNPDHQPQVIVVLENCEIGLENDPEQQLGVSM